MAMPRNVELLDLIDDTAPDRTAANAELVARAARQRGLLPDDEVAPAEPPWFGLEDQVQALESDGLVDVVVESVPHAPGDEAFPSERVQVTVTDAGREALDTSS
jgi:hypothetical protein